MAKERETKNSTRDTGLRDTAMSFGGKGTLGPAELEDPEPEESPRREGVPLRAPRPSASQMAKERETKNSTRDTGLRDTAMSFGGKGTLGPAALEDPEPEESPRREGVPLHALVCIQRW